MILIRRALILVVAIAVVANCALLGMAFMSKRSEEARAHAGEFRVRCPKKADAMGIGDELAAKGYTQVDIKPAVVTQSEVIGYKVILDLPGADTGDHIGNYLRQKGFPVAVTRNEADNRAIIQVGSVFPLDQLARANALVVTLAQEKLNFSIVNAVRAKRVTVYEVVVTGLSEEAAAQLAKAYQRRGLVVAPQTE